MKKLLFATAIAASAAAFADPINAIGFESYNNGATFANGVSESNEIGTGPFFYFEGESNSSVVSNDAQSASAKRTDYYDSLTPKPANAKYLALDTEGGTLWRSLGAINSETVGEDTTFSLGDPQAVAATGTYLDTLVQFTVTEDEEPTVGEGDKLAIWLQAGEGTTNLMVKAKAWALEGGVPAGVAASFTVSNVAVEPGAWYRLTVKAVQTIINPETGMIIPAFQIFIDGTEVAATTPQISTEMQDAFTGNNVWVEGMAALASANKLFPTLAGDPAVIEDVTLQGVGFQGTGAVDEIVWTEDNPLPAAPTTIAFTLTGGENATVSYVIGSEASQNWDGSSAISVESGATVTVTAAPNADFTYDTVSAEGWTPSNGSLTYTTNVTEATTLTVPDAIALYSLTIPNVANATASISGGYQIVNGVAKIPAGQTVTITWEPDSNYRLVGNASLELEVTDDTNLTNDPRVPTTADKFYTLTLTTNELSAAQLAVGGDTPADYAEAVSVEYGTNVTVTVAPNPGYEYATEPSGWTLDSESGAISTNFTIEAAVTLEIPTPEKIAYNLTINANATKVAYTATVNGESAGSTVNIGDVIVITATAKTGYNYTETPGDWTPGEGVITKTITVATADVEVTIPDPADDAPSGIEIEAGQQGGTTYATEADAAAVTNNVTITVPAAVSAAGVDKETYKANFEPKVVSDGNGGYKVEIGLTAAAEADLQTQANTDAGTLVSDITASTVTITTTPGFYYSIKYGSSLNAMNSQTAGVLADATTESITLPAKSGTSGFYKVVISIVPNEAVTP